VTDEQTSFVISNAGAVATNSMKVQSIKKKGLWIYSAQYLHDCFEKGASSFCSVFFSWLRRRFAIDPCLTL
jgi:hypothetical protein